MVGVEEKGTWRPYCYWVEEGGCSWYSEGSDPGPVGEEITKQM